jgi:hypothetical protein
MKKAWFVRAGVSVVGGLALIVPFATPAAAAGGLDPSFGTRGTQQITGPAGWTLRPMAMHGSLFVAVEATKGTSKRAGVAKLAPYLANPVDPTFNKGKLLLVGPNGGAFRGLDASGQSAVVLTDRGAAGFQVDWANGYSGAHEGTATFQGSTHAAAVVDSFGSALVCYTAGGRGRLAYLSPGGPGLEVGNLPANFPPCRTMYRPHSSDKLLIAGHTAGHNEIVIARTDLNGQLDPTFGVNGIARIARPGSTFQVQKIARESDGIFLAGLTQQTTGAFDPKKPSLVAIHKLGLNGEPQPTWGSNGLVRYQLRNLLDFDIVEFQKFVVGGIAAHSAGTTEYRLFRGDRTTGKTDPAWGLTGGYIVPPSSVLDAQSDGQKRLYTVGYPKGAVATIVQRRYL